MRERLVGCAGFSPEKMAPRAVECHRGRERTGEGGRSPETSLTGHVYDFFFLSFFFF